MYGFVIARSLSLYKRRLHVLVTSIREQPIRAHCWEIS
uniref:Uncharacterized protein n=1 Tax=Anguilla anguilla TaxID=7936 RepID=A0A0E9Q7P9_ANGAN